MKKAMVLAGQMTLQLHRKKYPKFLMYLTIDKFVSLIPIGIPAYIPREKRMKEWDEIFKVI